MGAITEVGSELASYPATSVPCRRVPPPHHLSSPHSLQPTSKPGLFIPQSQSSALQGTQGTPEESYLRVCVFVFPFVYFF